MGLFDRFRKRVHEVAEETDGDALSVEATSEEAQALLQQPDDAPVEAPTQPAPQAAPKDHGIAPAPAHHNGDQTTI